MFYKFPKTISLLGATLISAFILLLTTMPVSASNELKFQVLEEEITVQQFPSKGYQLLLYVAPGYGFNERSKDFANILSAIGIEVWMVDLMDNFFLPRGTESIRSFDGRYVAAIIEYAHKTTNKNITLMSSSYGAIPTLRGARQWQLNNPKLDNVYLNGAILFSPELYRGIPALGTDPDFEPITSATNIPIMIFQSELRNNRWQLVNVIAKLEQGHAVVYQRILSNIASFFYQLEEIPDPETVKAMREVPSEIPRVIKLLEATPTPLKAAPLARAKKAFSKGLDIKLRNYKGNKLPQPFNLEDINGERVVRNDFTNKVTVVNFWATWCPPCVEEIPMLNRLKTAMKGLNFELLSINFGEDRAKVIEFMKKVQVDFPVLLDEKGRISGEWNTIVLPSSYVIGPDGRFAYAVNAAIEWDRPEVIEAMKALAKQ